MDKYINACKLRIQWSCGKPVMGYHIGNTFHPVVKVNFVAKPAMVEQITQKQSEPVLHYTRYGAIKYLSLVSCNPHKLTQELYDLYFKIFKRDCGSEIVKYIDE